MAETNKFNLIDVETWPRGQLFYYFSQVAPTAYSLTVDVDITVLRTFLKKKNIKFYPAYLWLVTTMVNKQIAFKVAVREDALGYWDNLTPLYAVFHEDDNTISLMWTEYEHEFSRFYEKYIANQVEFGNNHGVLAQPNMLPPEHSFVVSCLPWIEFKHFSLHSLEHKSYYFPSIEAGKFFESKGKVLLPLSLTLHHATTDGWHVKNFLSDLQKAMNHPEDWLGHQNYSY